MQIYKYFLQGGRGTCKDVTIAQGYGNYHMIRGERSGASYKASIKVSCRTLSITTRIRPQFGCVLTLLEKKLRGIQTPRRLQGRIQGI